MRIYLMPNFTKPRTWELLSELCRRMAGLGITAAASEEDRQAMAAMDIGPVEPGLDAAGCDLILSIGGDGTIIHSAWRAALAGKPVVGVNLGRLGFLAQIEPEELEGYLLRLQKGDYRREKRFAIQAGFPREEDCLPFALNDIVFSKAPEQNLADFEIFCNGRLIDHYYADGVIFSTSTGSTAYALSYGPWCSAGRRPSPCAPAGPFRLWQTGPGVPFFRRGSPRSSGAPAWSRNLSPLGSTSSSRS